MHSEHALRLMADLLWTALAISAPLLGTMLVLGILISVFQVATQIQEQSLSTVPKLLVAVLVLVAFGPWMLKLLVSYSIELISQIPGQFGQ
jgi:flagellar biosynthetic protein FliQ